MLYLFGSGAFEGSRKVVKVGFTDNFKVRERQYKLHNPLGHFISTREGTERFELMLHLRLTEYKVEFLDEWFYYEPDVEEIFGQSEGEIGKWLWEHRSTIFHPLPDPGTLKREILDNLNILYGPGTSEIEGTKL